MLSKANAKYNAEEVLPPLLPDTPSLNHAGDNWTCPLSHLTSQAENMTTGGGKGLA